MGAGRGRGRGRGGGAGALLLLPPLLLLLGVARAQVAWTPIYVDGNSQVDLWTQEAQGCSCPFDAARRDCACCVRDGGCHCGRSMPNRCSQCGLEQHCGRMCNVTLDSRFLASRSGKTFGQIKSPSLEGPAFCWFLLQPDVGQRVEVQVYRLVSAGRFNGTSCEGGFLQLVDGQEPSPRAGDVQICGGNERYAPPVVLFADRGPASLIFQIGESTLRSQFLAYYSFTPSGGGGAVGFQARGGRRIDLTECDWLYQDFLCREPGSCVLASPGYPGLYPPNRQCKYHITTSSIQTQVHISFTSLLLPYNHCRTHYVAIYQGSTPSSPLLNTLCSNRKAQFTYSGPKLLLEFSSGPPVPPYDYNGFLATLEFTEKITSTESSTGSIVKSTEPGVMRCDLVFSGNDSRSGHFDTKDRPWSPLCTLTFVGRPTDIVHISLFNYQLRAPSCQTVAEVYDGYADDSVKPRHRLCSPLTKHAQDPSGRFLEQQTFVSSDNALTLVLRRPSPSFGSSEKEFLNGAFLFHDEQVDGTLRPDTLCDVDYYGLSSPRQGHVTNPGGQQLFWNYEGTLRCSQRFIPAANQSITLTITTLARLSANPNCHTLCGDSGCRCVTKLIPLLQMDHLAIITDQGQVLSCLCGDFQQQWLPVSVRSWSPMRLVYSVAHYSWNMQGFQFTSSYAFVVDSVCGYARISEPAGEIHSKNISSSAMKLNHYFHQDCVWLLDSKIERQLTIELATEQSRPCTAWNISAYKYDDSTNDNFGELLHTFCPRDRRKEIPLPWKLDTVLLRLRATTGTAPEYSIRWTSQIVRANTRVSGPTSAPSAAAGKWMGPWLGTLLALLWYRS
ncbi:hypothetical protein R5R35_012776 [Gryllus longicercus]|uniref:CUB domain-containing protein n=1 Tax=Gryllus longicercus TaxID=2509291 RepID=A0AAN9VCV6_9ORTH